MNSISSLIDINTAKKIALEQASSLLRNVLLGNEIAILQDRYLEAEYCWMFFRNKEIFIPEEQALADGAFVVSKKGAFRYIADFSSEPEKLQSYLETMSNYFKDRGE